MIHALLLGAMAFLPVHGRYPIGRTKFDWVDTGRNEPSAAGHKRELVVYVWYPAEARADCTPAPYLPDAALMSDALPKEVASTVASAKPGACLDAPLSRAEKRYPVIIFSPGDEFKTLGYSALQEDLASRGYIVAAIDVPYNAPVVELSGGRITRPPAEEPPPQNLSPEALKQYGYDQTMAQLQLWAEDIAFVAHRMEALDRTIRVSAVASTPRPRPRWDIRPADSRRSTLARSTRRFARVPTSTAAIAPGHIRSRRARSRRVSRSSGFTPHNRYSRTSSSSSAR
jgi:hypothetical protein